MNRRRILAITLITILITATTAIESSAAGRTTAPASNTILNGKGAPKKSLGIDGDFYIDTRSLLIYGPKAKGKWPTPANLQGPTGASGSDGKNGSDGKTISSASTTAQRGEQGATGPQGVQGLPGEKGEKGDAGLPGLPGLPGANGASGPAGSPGGSGPAGAQGPTGATGAQGPAGPSEVTVVDIPQWLVSSAMPFSYTNSALFGDLLANKSYLIQIHISGTSAYNNLVLGLELQSAGSTVTYTYNRSDFRYATNSTTASKYGFDVIATVMVGSSNSQLSVRIYDGLGDSGAAPLTLTGKAYITLVGSIR